MARSRASANIAAMRYRWNERTGALKQPRKQRQLQALARGRVTAQRKRREEMGDEWS
jgi:hypothetical protein